MSVLALDRARVSGVWTDFQEIDIASDAGCRAAREGAKLARVSAIIHCAGYAHRPIETEEEVRRFFAINRDGTQRVIDLAKAAGVPRIVYLSSMAFYDWTQGTDFNEDGPLAKPTAYAASKLEGELACRESGLDWRVARLGTVFGDGDRANFAKLAAALARGRFVIPGKGDARKSVLPVELAAELLVELALNDRASRQIVNLALPQTPTLAEICAAYAELCSFRPARRVPLGLLRAGAWAGDLLAKRRPNFPLTSVNLRKLTTSTTVDTTRMRQLFAERDWGDFARWLQSSATYYRSV
jgi:UDP-glucose 4-epimerase